MEVWVQGWPVPAMNGVTTPISRVITPVTHCPITPSITRKGPRCEMILESTKFQEEFPQNFHAEKNWHHPFKKPFRISFLFCASESSEKKLYETSILFPNPILDRNKTLSFSPRSCINYICYKTLYIIL